MFHQFMHINSCQW